MARKKVVHPYITILVEFFFVQNISLSKDEPWNQRSINSLFIMFFCLFTFLVNQSKDASVRSSDREEEEYRDFLKLTGFYPGFTGKMVPWFYGWFTDCFS